MNEAKILSTDDSAQVRDALIHAAHVQAINAKKVLTMADVAVIMGKSDYTVRRWIASNKIPAPNSRGLWEAKAFFTFISNPHR